MLGVRVWIRAGGGRSVCGYMCMAIKFGEILHEFYGQT